MIMLSLFICVCIRYVGMRVLNIMWSLYEHCVRPYVGRYYVKQTRDGLIFHFCTCSFKGHSIELCTLHVNIVMLYTCMLYTCALYTLYPAQLSSHHDSMDSPHVPRTS